MSTDEKRTARFLYEIGQLKLTPRSGWAFAGVESAESVAEHSHRCAAIAYILAASEGANPERSAAMAVFHDLTETRLGDLNGLTKRYFDKTAAEHHALEEQLDAVPDALSARLRELIDDYESQESLEARCAKDADLIECLLQAREYAALGIETSEWVETSVNGLKHESARRLAEACLAVEPREWWKNARNGGARARTRTSEAH